MLTETKTPLISYFGEYPKKTLEDDVYIVGVYDIGGVIRLDISRKNKRGGISWDELQRIKNECGYSELDGLELYPAKNDVINNGCVRHIYIVGKIDLVIRSKNNG